MKPIIITKKYFKNGRGFTLIELVVVMAVFMFIIGAAIGIFISIVQAQKKVLAEQQLLNQVSYAEEYMSKALRMAKKDTGGTCLVDNSPTSPNPGYYYQNSNYLLTRPDTGTGFFTGIKFINSSDGDSCDEYYLNTTSSPYVLEEIKENGSTAVPLTSSNMQINFVRFGLDGSNGATGSPNPISDQDNENIDFSSLQPRVSIVMSINIPGDSQSPTRIIQTTISQRNLNVK
jgi:prepilin-type N-terminal cleavage/methylation domain-containing protein